VSRLLVEPPRALVPRRRPSPHRSLTLAATAAAFTLTLASSGDLFLVAVLLGLATADVLVAGVGALVTLSVLARWGTTSLPALAGLQSVLGPAGITGEAVGVTASWSAAVALVVCAGGVPRRIAAVPLGLLAGLLVAGPAVTGGTDAAVRLAGVAVGAGTAAFVAGRVPGRVALPLAALVAALAVGAGVLA
jgi:hypothetical protein